MDKLTKKLANYVKWELGRIPTPEEVEEYRKSVVEEWGQGADKGYAIFI